VRVSKGLPGSAPALAGQGSGVGASQAVRIHPEFQLNEEVTAESQICTVVSPRSDKQTVQQAPAALAVPAFDPVYDGGQYVVFRQLVNGAHVTIRRGAAVIGGDDTASSAATFRVNPPLAAGDHPEATQELCGVSSPPGTTTVLPCASLPAVHMHATKAGDTVVRLIDPVPGSRIFIFASGEEVGDGGGPEIQLTRPLRYGEIVESVQMLGTCIASTSHRVTVGSGLSDPTERGSCKVEGWEYGRPGSPETYTTDVSSYFNSPDADVSIPMNAVPRHALVRYPVGAGPFPLVLIVHGNHIPPHEASEPGYVYLLDHLASHCMIAASVDENFLNGWVGGEMDARAIVLLRHLQLWREWNQTPGNRWYGKVNMSALGLSGHSRGGEAITVAHLLDTLKHNPADPFHNFNFGITALYAIAPVDGQNDVAGISPVTLRKADYYVMHGTHDGDVWEFDGQRMFDRAMPVAETVERYKGLLWVYGANHGQWNTVWGTGSESVVQPVGHRISGPDQRTIGLAYITAFFLKSLRGYSEYKDFFTGEATFNSLPGARRVTQYQDPKRLFLDHYEEDADVATGSAAGVTNSSNALSVYKQTTFSDHGPDYWLWQQTNGLIAGWEKTKTGEVVVRIPPAVAAQASSYTHLAFRVAQTFEQPAKLNTVGANKDFSVQLRFGNVNSTAVLVSSKAALPYPEDTGGGTKTILQTVRIPWQDFVPKGDQQMSALTEIHLRFDPHDAGLLAIDEIQFTR
jgi:hypothetical protein